MNIENVLIDIFFVLYNDRAQELCFNGTLTKNNEETLEQQLHRKLVKVLKNRCDQIK